MEDEMLMLATEEEEINQMIASIPLENIVWIIIVNVIQIGVNVVYVV